MKNNYNGFLNIYKEKGWTSMDVVAKLRGILGMRKIGHAGTLDPMAEGVLPVALGRATKQIDPVTEGTKTYVCGMLIGTVTDTQDITGKTISSLSDTEMSELKSRWDVESEKNEEILRNILKSFEGEYEQLTPMYSARKVNGRKLYEYAREGKEVERKKKKINIESIVIEKIDFPHVVMTVTCSKGTYIRTLCHDIGEKLGVGACMESLIRSRVGKFRIEDALKLSDIERLRDEGRIDEVLSIEADTAVAIGKFDGSHCGHRKLLKELIKDAAAKKLRTCVVILDINKKNLNSPADRKKELYELGIDYVIELPFTEKLRNMGAEDFVRDILVGRFRMKAITAGPDISFGYNKEGNVELIKALSEKYGYSVHIIDKLTEYNREVSSSFIKEELMKGNTERVKEPQGYNYSFIGKVVHGRHLGETVLGFPTMNLIVDKNRVLAPFGVYAVKVFIYPDSMKKENKDNSEAKVHYGIANLGLKPTVSDEPDYDPERIDLETNVFDYSEDAYGKTIRVELISFIRPERKFNSLEEVREQLLTKDIGKAREILGLADSDESRDKNN